MAWIKRYLTSADPRLFSVIVAVLLALPFPWKAVTGFYSWLSPFIMLNSVLALKSFVWLNLIGGIILITGFLKKRWFCRNLCPVGWGCDKISSLKTGKKFSVHALPRLGEWIALISVASAILGLPLFAFLDPMALFNGFFTVFATGISLAAILSLAGLVILLAAHFILPGIWCSRLCPLGGLHDISWILRRVTISLFRKEKIHHRDYVAGRRVFLASGAGLLSGFMVPGFVKGSSGKMIRPPGSLPDDLFNTLCIRCGSCSKVCPTGIIRPFTGNNHFLAWLTPELKYEKGYCLETCNLCSQVCPSGSITLFDPAAKNQLVIGIAEINLQRCLLTANTECDRCRNACKYKAIEIVQKTDSLLMEPIVLRDKCVGCGACDVICPVRTIRIVPVF